MGLPMLSALIVAVMIVALLVGAKRISDLLLHGERHTLTRTPKDYGLDYEDVAFPSKDRLRLNGWWLPASAEWADARGELAPAVILLHPMFGNRQGLAADGRGWPFASHGALDLLDVACGFHAAGYAALLFDFRSHGESQAGTCAGGYNEDQDVVGAVEYVFARMAAEAPCEVALDGTVPAGAEPRVGVVGFGLGAAAAITAVGREKGDSRTIRVFSADNENSTGFTEYRAANIKKLRFIVAVAPASPRTLLRGYFSRVFPPLGWLLVPLVDRFCRWRGGYPLDGVLLIDFARHIHTPVLYAQARRDPGGGSDELQRICEATVGPKEIWWIEDQPDGPEVYKHVANHLERVLTFSDCPQNTVE